ncbi:MAG TPA: hypothetical protein VJ063_13450 [Verrucomicrobiae bacterium]|nr:hypothetical protein [Verrucomicrobiae bacterium]
MNRGRSLLQATLRDLSYYFLVARNWTQLTVHNSWGILNVLDIIWLRPMHGGLIDERNPFCTGADPGTGKSIWWSNLLFRTPRRELWNGSVVPDSDEVIIEKVGDYLRKQVLHAASSAQHPHGRPARMPPGILYLHGGVHYNGGWLLFNDFKEAIEHYSDRRFRAELKRFVREQKREPVTLFRDRDYDRQEFARFVCFMRSVLPWFSNSNGPKKFVLWGNPSPYPAVNTITGNWIADCRALKTHDGRAKVARQAIPSARYFQNGPYRGERSVTRWPEHLLALFTEKRIAVRGEKENLYFVDKRKLNAGYRFGPDPLPTATQRMKQWFAGMF